MARNVVGGLIQRISPLNDEGPLNGEGPLNDEGATVPARRKP